MSLSALREEGDEKAFDLAFSCTNVECNHGENVKMVIAKLVTIFRNAGCVGRTGRRRGSRVRGRGREAERPRPPALLKGGLCPDGPWGGGGCLGTQIGVSKPKFEGPPPNHPDHLQRRRWG